MDKEKFVLRRQDDESLSSDELLSGSRLEIPDENSEELAEWVSRMISESGTMLPKTKNEVLTMFASRDSVMIVAKSGQPLAHGSIALIYAEAKVVEVGGIIVDPVIRKRGLGAMVTRLAIEQAKLNYPDWTRMAFCNEGSLPIFLGLGAKRATFEELSLFPKEAWEVCALCPKKAETDAQGKLCCDTPVIIP